MDKKVTFNKALVTVIILVFVMFISLVIFKIGPHIPLMIGCGVSGCVARLSGYKWEDILEGMVDGISRSLESIIILMLTGVLIAAWIISGVVPSLIYYGLKILSPKYFLVCTMIICSVISMASGSWGTAGTVGLAFMGIASAMDIPLPLAAGSIISGAYVGDKLSPLSDSSNLAAAVSEVDVFKGVRTISPVVAVGYLIAALIFLVVGLQYGVTGETFTTVNECISAIEHNFSIGIFTLLPLIILLICVIIKIPAIPSIGISIIVSYILSVLLQGVSLGEVLATGYDGYVCNVGDEMLDALLTNGGIAAVLYAISVIFVAMMFGGIMEKTGQMEVLISPVAAKIKSQAGILILTIFTCILINIVLPDQYIAIAMTGRLYVSLFDKYNIKREHLFVCLGAGGAATSALVPWNTCGVFMSGVLGISTYQYMPYCFYNILMPVIGVIVIALLVKRYNSKTISD